MFVGVFIYFVTKVFTYFFPEAKELCSYETTYLSVSLNSNFLEVFLFNLLLRVEFYYISEAISLIIFQSKNMKESYDEHSSMKFCKDYNCNYNYFSGFLIIITGWVNKQKNI